MRQIHKAAFHYIKSSIIFNNEINVAVST